MRRLALLVAVAAAAGCGPTDGGDVPLSPACTEGPGPFVQALRGAPQEARLGDGTPLSACIDGATSEADLQNVGLAMTAAAEQLEGRATTDERAALELGFLVGAARRGAGAASAIQAELVRRLERSAALDPDAATPATLRAVTEGLKAGEARG